MLAELAGEYPGIIDTFAQASEVLGYDAWDLIQQGEQEAINLTERTQPLLLSASVALWRVWQDKQGRLPALLAGHSLGEWSALTCAGVLDFADAVNLVRLRGAYMQEAVPRGQGTMAAIMGLDDQRIQQCCEQAAQGQEVASVNYNAPGQVVIAGVTEAVERAVDLCKQAGAKKAAPLAVSAPFHTRMMKPAADKLAGDMANVAFKTPAIPIVHNVHAKTESDPDRIRELMIQQIYNPVRWVDCVKNLVSEGVEIAVECGPGKVLCGLNKRIDKDLSALSTDTPDSFAQALEATV